MGVPYFRVSFLVLLTGLPETWLVTAVAVALTVPPARVKLDPSGTAIAFFLPALTLKAVSQVAGESGVGGIVVRFQLCSQSHAEGWCGRRPLASQLLAGADGRLYFAAVDVWPQLIRYSSRLLVNFIQVCNSVSRI